MFCVLCVDSLSNDMYALCYACGFYIPMDQIGSHDDICSASEEEKKKVSKDNLFHCIGNYSL